MCSSSFTASRVLQAVGVSDHHVQIAGFDISVSRNAPEFRFVRVFRGCCWDEVKSCFSNAPWSVMELFYDIDVMWEYFYGIVQSCMNSYIPLKKMRLKYSKRPTPWLTYDILSTIQTKYKAKRVAECTCDPINITRYKTIKNSLKMAVCSAKLEYLQY